MNISAFIAWQAQRPSRSVEIKIRARMFPAEGNEVKIWVYDALLDAGQFVETAAEIDLEGRQEAKDRAELERLQKRYQEN